MEQITKDWEGGLTLLRGGKEVQKQKRKGRKIIMYGKENE